MQELEELHGVPKNMIIVITPPQGGIRKGERYRCIQSNEKKEKKVLVMGVSDITKVLEKA